MYVKETQLVILAFPREAHLYNDFKKDKDWHEVSISTVGATFEKVIREGFVDIDKGALDGNNN